MKLWLCKSAAAQRTDYYGCWVTVASDGVTAGLYHPRGLLKWDGSSWRYLPGRAPVYDRRYHRLEADGSFDPYKVGTFYYDQTVHFADGPADVLVLRCLGEAGPDLLEGVVVMNWSAQPGIVPGFWTDEAGERVWF